MGLRGEEGHEFRILNFICFEMHDNSYAGAPFPHVLAEVNQVGIEFECHRQASERGDPEGHARSYP